MNVLGSVYLHARRRWDEVIPRSTEEDQKSVLTEQFRNEWFARSNIDSEQLLEHILEYTADNVPFYRQYFARHRDRDPSILTDWPILTRDHLFNDFDKLKSTEFTGWKTWLHASGGSSGQPVAVMHDEYFAAKAQALRELCKELFFNGPHYNQLILWGTDQEVEDGVLAGIKTQIKDEVRLWLGIKTTQVNTCEFTGEKFEQCVDVLRRQKPDFIFGYAGSIHELARYLEANNIEPSQPPKMIGTTAETLHPFMRQRIEQVFKCKVCDHYGSREIGPAAWQHACGDMYFPKFFSKVEVVDAHGQGVALGETGRILLTGLHNHAMPLIRYDIGDIGVQGQDTMFKGYPFSTLKAISGRSSETFVNAAGTRVAGLFFIDLFYFRPWLDQFYIVQRDYSLIEIMYVCKDPDVDVPDEDREEIVREIEAIMAGNCRVIWTKVDDIPVTKSGKRLFIRSEVH